MTEIRGLYAITDPVLTPENRMADACEAALRGGAHLLQYRDKDASPALRRQRATTLAELCRRHGALFLVNDDPELACEVGAAGVHMGQRDGAIAAARKLLGPDALIGISCHGEPALARQAADAGADYVAMGRFHPSRTKPHAPPASLEALEETCRELSIPVVAIGGINPDNAGPLLRAGASAIAVIHGLFAAGDIEARAREFTRIIESEGPLRPPDSRPGEAT